MKDETMKYQKAPIYEMARRFHFYNITIHTVTLCHHSKPYACQTEPYTGHLTYMTPQNKVHLCESQALSVQIGFPKFKHPNYIQQIKVCNYSL